MRKKKRKTGWKYVGGGVLVIFLFSRLFSRIGFGSGSGSGNGNGKLPAAERISDILVETTRETFLLFSSSGRTSVLYLGRFFVKEEDILPFKESFEREELVSGTPVDEAGYEGVVSGLDRGALMQFVILEYPGRLVDSALITRMERFAFSRGMDLREIHVDADNAIFQNGVRPLGS